MASILNVDQINNAAGTSAITIDANGNTLMPGHVVQVVRTDWSADSTISSTSFTDTGKSATITPSSTSSKILIILTTGYWVSSSGFSDYLVSTIYRNGTTNIGGGDYPSMMLTRLGNYDSNYTQTVTGSLYDSPATTSAVTYNYYARTTGGTTIYYSDSRMQSSITLMEIAQ